MADEDRTVQVPVSLIERTAAEYERDGWVLAAEKWRALLLQPAPTAEPWYEKTPRTDEQFVADLLAEDATPPRIEDMAPEHSYEAMRTDIISALAADGFSYLESEQLLRRFEFAIRDVTPPAVTE